MYSSKVRCVGVLWFKWNYDYGDMGVFIIAGLVVVDYVTSGMIGEVWYDIRSFEVVGDDMMVLVCVYEDVYVGDVMRLILVISEVVLYMLF